MSKTVHAPAVPRTTSDAAAAAPDTTAPGKPAQPAIVREALDAVVAAAPDPTGGPGGGFGLGVFPSRRGRSGKTGPVRVSWDTERHPNMLVSAPDGSAAGSLARLVATQAAAAGWRVVDLGTVRDDRTALDDLRSLSMELLDRMERMSEAGVHHHARLPEPPVPVLVVAERADMLAAWDPLAALHLGMLARMGRPAGILVVATVSEGSRLPDELDSSLSARVVLDGRSGAVIAADGVAREFYPSI